LVFTQVLLRRLLQRALSRRTEMPPEQAEVAYVGALERVDGLSTARRPM
jgi:hypothetical protein